MDQLCHELESLHVVVGARGSQRSLAVVLEHSEPEGRQELNSSFKQVESRIVYHSPKHWSRRYGSRDLNCFDKRGSHVALNGIKCRAAQTSFAMRNFFLYNNDPRARFFSARTSTNRHHSGEWCTDEKTSSGPTGFQICAEICAEQCLFLSIQLSMRNSIVMCCPCLVLP